MLTLLEALDWGLFIALWGSIGGLVAWFGSQVDCDEWPPDEHENPEDRL